MQTATTTKTGILATDSYISTLLEGIPEGKRSMSTEKGETIFSQGERADAIYFIQAGRVKVSVVSASGQDAVLGILGSGNFFGEESLIGQALRPTTATTLNSSTVLRVETGAMERALQAQPALSATFIASLIKRTLDREEDLCDQLFNHCEKRLARALLKIARLRESEVVPNPNLPPLSHETLAEMVGTTRSRVTHFMNRFKTNGLIEYKGPTSRNGFRLVVSPERLASFITGFESTAASVETCSRSSGTPAPTRRTQ